MAEMTKYDAEFWYDTAIRHDDQAWRKQIANAIIHSDAVIMFVTRGIFSKDDNSYVYKENDIAKGYKKGIYYIVMDEIVTQRDVGPGLADWWIGINNLHIFEAWKNGTGDTVRELTEYLGLKLKSTINGGEPTKSGSAFSSAPSLTRGASSALSGKKRVLYNDGSYYEGDVVNGKRHGWGTVYYNNGDRYEGPWVNDQKDSSESGKDGTYHFADGSIFIGKYRNGKRNGPGKQYYSDGKLKYEGDYLDGKWHGWGIYYYEDGDRYEGPWVNDQRDSSESGKDGTYHFADGSIFIGKYRNDKRNGPGKQFYSDGKLQYEGEYLDGKRHGWGIYYYEDGDRYEGPWVNDQRDSSESGKDGTYRFADGSIFIGKYRNGKRNGPGKKYYSDGKLQYEGEYLDGKCHGWGRFYYTFGDWYEGPFAAGEYDSGESGKDGTYHYADGRIFTGKWCNGKRNGYGSQIYADGTRCTGTWVNSKRNRHDFVGYKADGTVYFRGIIENDTDADIVYSSGDRYCGPLTGTKKDGNGEGTYRWRDGRKYVGFFKNNEFCGSGKLYYSNGKLQYSGEWKDSCYHGQGTSYNEDGSVCHSGRWANHLFVG